MKKRIGNDITITWKIYRKNGEIKEPELFDGKDVIVELMSPSQRPAKIDNVGIATGVVTFTFKGKNQHILGSYTAVLSENRGADGMVTIDTIEAVTLVPYSYMEAFNRCENITASSVDIESEIDYSGGIAQQQADWEQTDDTAVDFIKNKPNLDVFARLDAVNKHTGASVDMWEQTFADHLSRTTVGHGNISIVRNDLTDDTTVLRMDDKYITFYKKGVGTLQIGIEYFKALAEAIQSKANAADLAKVAVSNNYNDLDNRPTFDVEQEKETLIIF